MAEQIAPLSAKPPSFLGADGDAQKEYFDALNKALASLENRAGVNLFNVAGALFNPGRTGQAFEAIGNAASAAGRDLERDELRGPQIAQMRAALAGQKYDVQKKEKAYGLIANAMNLGSPEAAQQALQTGQGIFGISNKFTPELYFAISRYDPKIADTVKNAAGMDIERYKAMIEATKMNMSVAQMYDQFGKDVTDRFMVLQGQRPPTSGGAINQVSSQPKPQTASTPAVVEQQPPGTVPMGEPVGRTPEELAELRARDDTPPAPVQSPSTAPPKVVPEYGTQDLGGGRFKLQPSGRIVNIDPSLSPKEQRARLEKEIEVDQELFKKREEADIESQAGARTKRGEPFQKKFDTLATYDYNTVQTNDLMNRELMQLVKDHPKVVGQLVHQGPLYALLQAAESGISTPVGSLSAPVTEVLNKLNLTSEEQGVARNVLQIISQLNQTVMRAGKDIYGPQISVFDAREMAKPGFATTDPASFIMYLASKNLVTNKFLGEMANAQQKYFDSNPNASTSSFFSSKNKEYTDIVDRLGATMRDLTQNSPFRKQ